MSEEEFSSEQDSPILASEEGAQGSSPRAKKVVRVSKKRAKTVVAEEEPKEEVAVKEEKSAEPVVVTTKVGQVRDGRRHEVETTASESEDQEDQGDDEGEQDGSDWPDSGSTVGGQASQEGNKRKRRRKKGKGGTARPPAEAVAQDVTIPVVIESEKFGREASGPESKVTVVPTGPSSPPNHMAHGQNQRFRLDPEELAKLACKIYLAEISEDGVALIGDGDARELSRRCFRLAEIFLDEKSRRRH